MKREDEPLVSVIVPFYNVEQYARRCLDSILKQDYQNLEIILIDDGSPDACGAIIDEYAAHDQRIKAFHTKNRGLSEARNLGTSKATGEFIAYIDSDDYITPDYISFLYKLLKKYDADISICDKEYEPKAPVVVEQDPEVNLYDRKQALRAMCLGDMTMLTAWGKLIRGNIARAVKYPSGKAYEDINTIYKYYFKAQKVVVSNEKKYFYQYNVNSILRSEFNQRDFDLITAADEMGQAVLKAYPDLASAVLSRRVLCRLLLVNKMLREDYHGPELEPQLKFIRDNVNKINEDSQFEVNIKKAASFAARRTGMYAQMARQQKQREQNGL